MSLVKIKLQDQVPPRVIRIETDATIGATLGTNLFMPSGVVATKDLLRTYLGIDGSGGVSGPQAHRLLTGLTLGDDHPQYTRKDTLTTRGDIYVRGAATVQRLPLGTVNQYFRVGSTDPEWVTVSPTITLGTDLSGSATFTNLGSTTLLATIPADTVTYAKMQNVSAASRLLGRGSAAGAGDPQEITLAGPLRMAATTLTNDSLPPQLSFLRW